jgi:hypothetical protein
VGRDTVQSCRWIPTFRRDYWSGPDFISYPPNKDTPAQFPCSLPIESHLILALFISTLKMETAYSSETYLPTRLPSVTTRKSTTWISKCPVRVLVRQNLERCRLLGFCRKIYISFIITHVLGTLTSFISKLTLKLWILKRLVVHDGWGLPHYLRSVPWIYELEKATTTIPQQ